MGDGAKKEELLSLKDSLELENVTMLPSVAKDKVRSYISILDIALVNLRKSDTFKSVIPSKIFEFSAMHKPILLGVEGEAKKILENYGIGEAFEPENETDFKEKIEKILVSEDLYYDGSKKLMKDFNRSKLAIEMLDFIED